LSGLLLKLSIERPALRVIAPAPAVSGEKTGPRTICAPSSMARRAAAAPPFAVPPVS
jgi:hypothetical protein